MNNNNRPSGQGNDSRRPGGQQRQNQNNNNSGGQFYRQPNGTGRQTPNSAGQSKTTGKSNTAGSTRYGAQNTGRNTQNSQKQTPMSRINTQNPNQRRASQQKIKLTAEQIEINRVNRQREKYYIKKRRSAVIRTFISRIMLFLVVLAVLCGVTASLFFLNLIKTDSQDVSGYTYKIGDGRAYTLSYGKAVRDSRVYVDFTDIAELCDLAVTGSPDDIKYVIKGDETETIRFITGTRVVYVNTVETRLGGDSYYSDGDLYVPADFVAAYFKGLEITVDSDKHLVTVARQTQDIDTSGDGKEVFSELYFLLQLPAALDNINEDDASKVITMPDLGFATDLSAYEDYMNPGNTTEYLSLINVSHQLASDYVPQDLTSVADTRDDGRAQQMMRLYAEKALEALFIEMRAAGFDDVSVTSGYRSYSYQEQLFNQQLAIYSYLGDGAYAQAATVVNPPGSSEHQSGLCADFHNLASADVSFADTDAYKWISENCWKFGFILRYTEDKTDVTGISYEPWHYRYVGRYHAQQMKELGMCLEEYCTHLGYK